jgi:hypothetical protein
MKPSAWVPWFSRCALLAAIALPLGYCNLPLRSFGRLVLHVEDQSGGKVTDGISATYLDDSGATVHVIDARTPDTFENRLYWWASQSDHDRHARPEALLRVVAVRIAGKNCETRTIPVALQRKYERAGLTAHGAHPARFMYTFSATVVLRCQ